MLFAPFSLTRTMPPALVISLGLAVVAAPVHPESLAEAVFRAEIARDYDDALLRRAAAAPQATVRRAATRAAARLKNKRAVAWLLPLFRDESGPVRRGALFACGQIAAAARGRPVAEQDDPFAVLLSAPASVFVAIRQRLEDAPDADVPAALDALAKTRDARAAPTVLAYLRHDIVAVRGSAALALARLRDPAALPEMRAALVAEKDDESRWRLVYASWLLLREQARRVRPAPGPNTTAKSEGTNGAGAQPRRPRLPRSTKATHWARELAKAAGKDRPYAERAFAVRALAWVRDGRGFLFELFEDPDARIVQTAVLGYSVDWSPESADQLLDRLLHNDALVRRATLRAIAAGRSQARPHLVKATAVLKSLEGHDRELYREAVVLANEAGAAVRVPMTPKPDDETLAFYWRAHARSPQDLPRGVPSGSQAGQAAAEVCGRSTAPMVPVARAVPLLLALTRHGDPVLRAAALDSLAARAGKEHAAHAVALARAAQGTMAHGVRVAAADALAKWKTYDPWLREAAVDPDHPVRAAARAALRRLGRSATPLPRTAAPQFHGLDARALATEAAALRGARLLVQTSRGAMKIVLYPDIAPVHCVNVVRLVRRKFYDGLTWHRVVGNFVIQGGCPRGDGAGGPGYFVPDEVGARAFVRGTLGMPRSGPDTGGCQLFVTHLPTPHLDGAYTVFGQIVRGFAVLDKIRKGDKITTIRVELPAR